MRKRGLPGPRFKVTSGIYLITCIPTGDTYIGKSKNLSQRWCQHRSDLRANTHNNPKLQELYNAHGWKMFEMTLLELIPEKDSLETREAYWIANKNPSLNIVDTKLSRNDVNQINDMISSGSLEEEISQKYNITVKYLKEILRGGRWK
jgi:group I intron endonuclease